MKTTIATSVFFLLFASAMLNAQTEDSSLVLTGNLEYDTQLITEAVYQPDEVQLLPDSPSKKSPFLAGLLSALVPGAGEIYTENYLKAGIFVAVEAAAISLAIIYNNKGDDQTQVYEDYANANWSVVKYAQWIENNKEGLGIPVDCQITINPDASLKPWERVNWQQLNSCEREADHFSHTLAPYDDQQYYEMIGKYRQFSHGWADKTNDATPDYELLTPMLTYYAGLRGEANDYYNYSSTAVVVIFINHILSAVDAAWSAASFNDDIALNVRMEPLYLVDRVDMIPKVGVTYSFTSL